MNKQLFYLLNLTCLTLTLTLLLLAYPALVLAGPPPQPQVAGIFDEWIIWEMDHPPQSLLIEGNTLWAGSYKGGLYQWHVETGYQAHYTATHGLVGEDIAGLARNSSGHKLVAAVDGGLASGNGPFTDLTPAGGERAWDVAVAGGDVWLATLGGGVARYSGGSWSRYHTANSTLPFDDVYAVAVAGSTPWVGTIGYGLARFDGSDWVTYTLPVEIPHPVTATDAISNNAVTDIALDSSGNKWLATDGSGVVKLNSANTTWTVYNTSNSNLPDNFVHSITVDGDYLWFGTLGGGAASFYPDGDNWEVFDTSSSPMPDDDVLAVAIDNNGSRWFATFDTGLTFHGLLPETPPVFDLEPRRAPTYVPGEAKSYYLWLDPVTYRWHLAWSGDGTNHSFTGQISADAPIITATTVGLEGGDNVTINGGTLSIAASEAISQDLVTFELARQTTQLTVELKIDDAYRPFNIRVGETGAMPATAPFRLTPPQPVPPEVRVEADQTLAEGAFVFLTGVFTDTDSPLEHTIAWQMGDGATLTNTLAPLHTYADDGFYSATLTITDVHAEFGSASAAITVTNVAPEVDFFVEPSRPEPGQTLTFTGSAFDPGLADELSYFWTFGDGLTATNSLTVTHSYAITGDYDVILTVYDDDGGVGVISYPVTIEPFGADFTGYPGVGLPPFTATFYDTSAGQVMTRTWDFGDGSPAVITTATTTDHVYQTPGLYTVSLTVYGPSGSDLITRPNYIVAVSPLTSGTVILEAESYTRQFTQTGPTWETRTDHLGYSGSGYVQATPDVDVLLEDAAAGFGSELQYDLGLTITGTYTIWLRGYAANAAGDSVYVGLNGQLIGNTEYVSEYPPRTWAWGQTLAESSQPVTFTVESPGVHTLSLWVREDGFSLDQIILTTDDNFAPEG